MKMIMEYYDAKGDRYIEPMIYPSKEALLEDFMSEAWYALDNNTDFEFLGRTFDPYDFFYLPEDQKDWIEDMPTLYSIDEFFEDAFEYTEKEYQNVFSR